MSRWKESYLVSSFPHLVFRRNSQICEERERKRETNGESLEMKWINADFQRFFWGVK
jgi:hypothetical protein